MKSVARHGPIAPEVYADWATKLWTVWRSPRSVVIKSKGSLVLQLMSPLQKNDGDSSIAGRYWSALFPLFQIILASGDGNEVYSALFHLDIDQLLPVGIQDLARTLQAAAKTAAANRSNGMNGEARIVQVLLEIASHQACPREIASEIHQTLLGVGARREVLDLERRWHERSGS
jgi:hypothetical protein